MMEEYEVRKRNKFIADYFKRIYFHKHMKERDEIRKIVVIE